ncbi:MAG: putative nucleic acid-binding Zn-ribbon protein [Woeseiaceae bacterium]|jgi:predicted  nucleic acid-binding Zn-ribbon protein|tara:strand:- start:5658 stop:5921 length:264 start_codon:yes stop_codon:yes gene_type:complete
MFTQNIKLCICLAIIFLSGCAVVSQEMVDDAQATANHALNEAEAANTRAENAEMIAEAAQNSVKNINYDYNEIVERMERMFQKAQEK